MATAMVTGAAGFLGSHLTERLLALGHEVVGVDCFTTFYDPARKRENLAAALEHPRFRLLELDLASGDLARLPESDTVYHLAAQAGVRPSWGEGFEVYLRDNVRATQRLLERYAPAPPRRLVYASSSSVYGDAERLPTSENDLPRPTSPYGVTKLAAEHLCLLYHRNFGLPCVALRFFTVYGPRQRPDMAFHRFAEAAIDGRPLEILGDGSQSRDFTYVADVVEAVAAAGERGRPGAVYNVASGRNLALSRAVAVLGELAGGPLAVRHRPRAAGDALHTSADIALAAAELGYRPQTPLEQGLAAQWAWHRERRAVRPETV